MTDENQQNQNVNPEDKAPEGSSGSEWGMGENPNPIEDPVEDPVEDPIGDKTEEKSTEPIEPGKKPEESGKSDIPTNTAESSGDDVGTRHALSEDEKVDDKSEEIKKDEQSTIESPESAIKDHELAIKNHEARLEKNKSTEPTNKPIATDAKPAEPAKTAKGASVPTKIGKEATKTKSNAKFLIIMGLGFAGLFIAFIVLMVMVIAKGGENSPVLQSFGIDASGIKSFLITVVNLSFGFLAFLFFILAVIGVFRLLFAKKGDKDARNGGIKMSIVGIVPMVFVMFIWLFLYNYIGGIQIAATQIKTEILITKPTDITKLQAPLTVTFSLKNVVQSLNNNKVTIKGASWDFDGDGVFETVVTAQEQEKSYQYNLKGSYKVGLKIDVTNGDPRIYYKILNIQDAVFGAIPTSGTSPLKVDFDASKLVKKTEIKSLEWDFDEDETYDSTGTTNLKPSYTFTKIGKYKVHLRYINTKNLVENYYRTIEVVKSETPLLTAKISATPALSGVSPLQIRFDGKDSTSVKGKVTSYEWDFGDGSSLQKGQSVSYTFSKVGTYTVTLTVKDDTGLTDSITTKVEVKNESSKPTAVISTTPTAIKEIVSGEAPLKVSFDASSSTDADKDIITYEWSINSTTKLGQKVDYTFDKAGSYTVTLKISDSDKQESTATIKVEAKEPGVKSVIKADPEAGNVPLTVKFDGSSSSTYKGSIVSYEWDFGDKTAKSISGANITHKYDAVGSYTVTLKITTNNNESSTSTKTITAREVPMKSCFSMSRKKGPAPFSVTFDSKCSTGAVSTYKWDFADTASSTARKPSHTFENAGTYNVTLEVSDGKNNVSTYSDVVVVETE